MLRSTRIADDTRVNSSTMFSNPSIRPIGAPVVLVVHRPQLIGPLRAQPRRRVAGPAGLRVFCGTRRPSSRHRRCTRLRLSLGPTPRRRPGSGFPAREARRSGSAPASWPSPLSPSAEPAIVLGVYSTLSPRWTDNRVRSPAPGQGAGAHLDAISGKRSAFDATTCARCGRLTNRGRSGRPSCEMRTTSGPRTLTDSS